MFESDQHLDVGGKVELIINGLGRIAATIVWSIDTRAGMSFDEALL